MNVDPNYMRGLAASINQSAATEQTLTGQLSSGLRVNQLSDDPVAAAANVGLSSSISRMDSFVQTATQEQSLMQVSDNALGEVVTQVTSALSLAVSAGNGTMNSTDLTSVQTQLQAIRTSVLALANTSYQGQYVFAGSKGSTTPFTMNTATNPATTTYNGDTSVQTVATPNGQQVAVNVPGSSVFMNAGGSLLGTLNQLISDVGAAAAGTGTTAGIQADSTALSTAMAQANGQRATLDSGLSQMTAASTYAATQGDVYKSEQSTLLSADPATIATELSAAETQHQALLSVTSTLQSAQDLFAYLK